MCLLTPKNIDPDMRARVIREMTAWGDAAGVAWILTTSQDDWEKNAAYEGKDWFYHVARHYQVYFALSDNVGKGVGATVQQVLAANDERGEDDQAGVYLWMGADVEPTPIVSVTVDEHEVKSSRWQAGYHLLPF